MRFVLQSVMAMTLVPIAVGPLTAADELDRSHSFKFAIVSHLDMDVQGKLQKIDTDSTLTYTWTQKDRERTVRFDSALVKISVDGKQTMNVLMNRHKLTNTSGGKTEEVPFDKAPEKLKTMLKDSFGEPMCRLQVGENGEEIKRQVVAGPGAKDFLEQGMLANALYFHPPFMKVRDEWSAANEISMGNGAFAKGNLTYKKVPSGKQGQAVTVTGTLGNDGFNVPGSPIAIKNAKYIVNGEQTYDPAQREWVAGKLKMNVSFDMTSSDKPFASTKGTMDLDFEKLPGRE
jgi:hypothetical protein